ncbi:MAG: hypothetical protein KKA79_03285 [Nanoarchaeota archaeon]|nr:hypothetical protein [Nanoarchaeota archaeon]MCG2718764.1 hypothetical protein [Nanoarchaeota archaeon]
MRNDLKEQYTNSLINLKKYYPSESDKRKELIEIVDEALKQVFRNGIQGEIKGPNAKGIEENFSPIEKESLKEERRLIIQKALDLSWELGYNALNTHN